MDIFWFFLICALATFTNGQLQDRPLQTGIGYIDGRQVRIDDLVEQRLGGRLSQNIIPAVRNIGPFGPERQRQVVVSGSLSGSLGQFGLDRLQPCRPNICTLEFIPRRCRYTPVLQSAFGYYCLGCPEDICETQRRLTPRQRRRRRRMRRRLCRNFGICLGRQAGSPLLGRQAGSPLLGNVIP